MISLDKEEEFLRCLRNELVPENRKTGYGIEGLINYRINKNIRHPDSMYMGYDKLNNKYVGVSPTAELFKEIYGKTEYSSDTIFNCWSYFLMFTRGRLNMKYVSPNIALERTDEIFDGYETLRKLFDNLADLQHSLANFMPAPTGFNGSRSHDGKGNFIRDNDMPDIYYKRAKDDFPKMYEWINKHMQDYCLQFFKEYKSPWSDKNANKAICSDEEIETLTKTIENAITCIKNRAGELYYKRQEVYVRGN